MCIIQFYNTFEKTCINHVNLVLQCWKVLHIFRLIDLCATVSITVLMSYDPYLKLKLFWIIKVQV